MAISPTFRLQSTSSTIDNEFDGIDGKRPFKNVERKRSKRKFNSKNSIDENLRNISDVNIFDNLNIEKCSLIVAKVNNPNI